MQQSMQQSLIPLLVSLSPSRALGELWCFLCGLLLMICLAQINLPLFFTPVPITGQTFGCILISLTWGRKRAPLIFLSYLGLGAAGLPVFSDSGGLAGPTAGYLLGMLCCSWALGTLADRGWSTDLYFSLLAGTLGVAIVFLFGLGGLSLHVPWHLLLQKGFWPFLPFDLVKAALASYLAYRASLVAAAGDGKK
jgi:biotin transport system substrate-specific component